MASRQKAYGVDRIDADGYDPDIVDGAVVGEFHQLEPSGSTAAALDACVWRSDPATYDYLFEKDEAFLVVEGAATVVLSDTGEKVNLSAGDIAYFSAGTRSVWTVTQPFKKFTVIAC